MFVWRRGVELGSDEEENERCIGCGAVVTGFLSCAVSMKRGKVVAVKGQ